jgi:dCMP deaminase
MVIGLTGPNGSGKTTLAEYLKDKGFYYHSLSDEIREELRRQDLPLTRENLIEKGNWLRRNYGQNVLAERVRRRLLEDRNYVVDSIRHPSEVETLRLTPHFYLFSVEAPVEARYRRAVERGDRRAPASYEEFVALERREMTGDDPDSQNLRACMGMADVHLVNEGTAEDFLRRAGDEVVACLRRAARPDWDEYFMRIARIVSLRSNCIKRKVAAIIVRDRRIIATGYNGTPRGVPNCNEGGCPRCNSLASSGTRLDECLCSHGEENAIVQSAYHGISIKGGTLYSTFAPCLQCSKMIINAGILEVVFNAHYPLNDTAFKLLEGAGVKLRQFEFEHAARG